MVMQRPGGIAWASFCATVVLPEPVPPAIPTTSGCADIAVAYHGRTAFFTDARRSRNSPSFGAAGHGTRVAIPTYCTEVFDDSTSYRRGPHDRAMGTPRGARKGRRHRSRRRSRDRRGNARDGEARTP